MTRRAALAAVVASTVAIAAAYASAFGRGGAPPWAPWLLAIGVPTLLVAMAALGAARPGRRFDARIALTMVGVWAAISGSFCLALVLPAETADAPALLLGLPRRAAVILYGVGLLPLLALPLAYALTFDEQTLSEDDVRRVREAGFGIRDSGFGTDATNPESRIPNPSQIGDRTP